MRCGMKSFRVITSLSMALTFTAAALGMASMAVAGFYPGIVVLSLLPLVPVASRLWAGRKNFRKNRYAALAIVNLLSILVVLWMTFVIVHDRILGDCCLFCPWLLT